jgi:hypothetical protein
MNITIKVIKVAVENKGKYQQAKVSYEEVGSGKVTAKTLLSFVHPEVFKLVTKANQDDVFSVSLEKDDKGYWQWTNATAGEAVQVAAPTKTGTTAVSSPRSTYETPEERAQRQVYIIRQSSLANAIQTLAIGSKTQPKQQDIVDLAKFYENYVFGKDAMTAITSMANDLPEEPEVD